MDSSEAPEGQKTFDQKSPSVDIDAESVAIAGGENARATMETKQLAGLADLDGIKRSWNLQGLVVIWISALLMSFALNLNNHTANSFASYATSEFASAPLLGTITVVQSVVSSVALQPLARLADVYGRFEMFALSVFLLTIGEIMIASSSNVSVYAGAQVFWAFGYIGISLMLQILAGDTSDLHNRALLSAIPLTPSLITCWIAGPVASGIIKITWRWGFGIFAIIIPTIAIPLLASLYINKRKGKKLRKAEGTYQRLNHLQNFLQLDPVGLGLLAAGLSLILIPISLASSNTNTWKSAHTIADLIVGAVCLVALAVWETKWAQWPILPISLLTSRTVIFGLSAMLINYAGLYLLQSYLIYYEMVAANLSVNAATNIYILIPFAGSLGQVGAALLVKYSRRYKWIVVSGYGVIVLGMGLTYKYINGHGQMPQLVVSQLILGIGEGIVMTTQFGVQASVSQADMAAGTALYTTAIGIGNAIGSAAAGGIWTSLLPRKLRANLPSDAASALSEIEGSVVAAMSYEWGTPIRDAINKSYTTVFRTMILAGLVLVAVALLCSLLVIDLNIMQVDESRDYKGVVIGKTGAVDALKEKVHIGEGGDSAPSKEDS
ncbi:siderophore iron transporter, putative [Talaromyces stipitatus ATCC 10500]|uniref:Siderophore iron transporter, putative n=1 Tax=Talaromyces stipitatus (strain ATCC 10500 / CBS 375.48 / QM 6759 / NRRL 1006) TaxID=441959 RepID=B8LTF6_TALSN|nr:siderophore iron transporter, putative [Talaromyces stipitatus ATCC 10500]EED23034.1 siderophore iron transporter, putative [Talaromyces stipitatus ATCC 10500]